MGQLARQRIWQSKGITGNDRLVLLALADMTPDDCYTCYPSVQTIADMSGASDRQAQRIIAKLQETGKIDLVRGHGRKHTTRYAVLVGLSEKEVNDAMIELKGDTAMSPNPTTEVSIKGDIKHDIAVSPFETEKVTDLEEKVTDQGIKGDTAMSPEQREQKNQQKLVVDAPQAVTPPPAPVSKPKKPKPVDPNQSHPAVIAFYEKTARRPNQAQAHLIANRVTDVDRWLGTITHWLLTGWSSTNVDGMVKRYERIDDRPPLPASAIALNGHTNGVHPPATLPEHDYSNDPSPYSPEYRASLRTRSAGGR